MQQTGTQAITALYAAWNDGDLATVMGQMTVDVVWNAPHGGHEHRDAIGLTEMREKAASVQRAWAGWSVEPDCVLETGDAVLASGVHRRPDGAEVGFRHLWDLRDGRVCRLREQIDTSALLHVLAGAVA